MNRLFEIEIFFKKNTLDYKVLKSLILFLNQIGEIYYQVWTPKLLSNEEESLTTSNIDNYINRDLHNIGLYISNGRAGAISYHIGNDNWNRLNISKLNLLNINRIIYAVQNGLLSNNMILFYINFYEYHFKMTTTNITFYETTGINYSKLPKKYDALLHKEVIDVSKNVGKEHHFDEFIFYTTYKMWFGPIAINKFGRERILSFREAEYLRVLPSGIIEMQLCDHIDRCDSPENIRRQKALLNHLGIEHYSEAELKPTHGGIKGFLSRWLNS